MQTTKWYVKELEEIRTDLRQRPTEMEEEKRELADRFELTSDELSDKTVVYEEALLELQAKEEEIMSLFCTVVTRLPLLLMNLRMKGKLMMDIN